MRRRLTPPVLNCLQDWGGSTHKASTWAPHLDMTRGNSALPPVTKSRGLTQLTHHPPLKQLDFHL